MKTEVTKESLISEFLAFNSAAKSGTSKLIAKFENFMAKNPPDSDLILALGYLKTIKADHDHKSFEVCCSIAVPAFEALKSITTWEYLHLYCLSVLLIYRPAFSESWEFFIEALESEALETHDSDEYLQVRIALHSNMTIRILRAKYLEPSIDNATLNDKFSQCYAYAMDMCVKRKRPQQHALQVRKGIYENDMELVKEGLKMLLQLGEKKRYKNAKANIIDYLKFMNENLTVDLLNTLQGHQISIRRKELDLSVAEVAFLADIEEPTLHAIERGDSGMSTLVLRNICKVLSISADYILGNDNAKPENEDLFITRLKAYVAGASTTEQEFILKAVALVKESMNLNKHEDETSKIS
ncbi:MAG: helix-turn-helix domain-containing protein [Defluviitaleaceae bacterium]|nr:helix-turn-helix domain-containing protein [Defluviitaleaceae bacterium]